MSFAIIITELRTDELKRILIAVTGASGSIYANRLLECLLAHNECERVHVIFSKTAAQVVKHELSGAKHAKKPLIQLLDNDLDASTREKVRIHSNEDLFAPFASGSNAPTAMVIVPGSMGAIARIAQGVSSSLIERAADVMLKQKRSLLVCPRESPLGLIHLRNMTTLCEAGAQIIPLMPGFYNRPTTIDDIVDFCVGRILEQLDLSHDLYRPWNSRMG